MPKTPTLTTIKASLEHVAALTSFESLAKPVTRSRYRDMLICKDYDVWLCRDAKKTVYGVLVSVKLPQPCSKVPLKRSSEMTLRRGYEAKAAASLLDKYSKSPFATQLIVPEDWMDVLKTARSKGFEATRLLKGYFDQSDGVFLLKLPSKLPRRKACSSPAE